LRLNFLDDHFVEEEVQHLFIIPYITYNLLTTFTQGKLLLTI